MCPSAETDAQCVGPNGILATVDVYMRSSVAAAVQRRADNGNDYDDDGKRVDVSLSTAAASQSIDLRTGRGETMCKRYRVESNLT